MEYRAIDLHKREYQIRIVAADGDVPLDRRITTARDRLTTVFEARSVSAHSDRSVDRQ
jgi:hypothetical protein